MPTRGGAILRTVAVTVGLTGLLVVVALTAGSLWDGPAGGRNWQIDRVATAAVVRQVLLVAYLAVLAHAFYLWLTHGNRSGRSAFRRPGAPALAIFLFLLLLLFLATFRLFTLEDEAVPEAGARPALTTLPSPDFQGGGVPLPGGVPESTTPGPDWPVLVAGLALVSVVLAVAVARRRPALDRSNRRTPSSPDAVTGPHHVRSPPPTDPRERVFAAYRSVEDAAGRTGRHRHPSETVSAHLSRLTSPGPAAADPLAFLYNRARFSSHPIAAEDASRAEQAGAEIRRRLR